MKKIDIEKLGQKYEGISSALNVSYDAYLATKTLAEKINEVIEKAHTCECHKCPNLAPNNK